LKTPEEVKKMSSLMLGENLVTKQTKSEGILSKIILRVKSECCFDRRSSGCAAIVLFGFYSG
jgi:hypothetical protein